MLYEFAPRSSVEPSVVFCTLFLPCIYGRGLTEGMPWAILSLHLSVRPEIFGYRIRSLGIFRHIIRELRGLHTHMVFVSSVLEQIRISVNFMTDRFSGDKLANLRPLPEGEQRRLSEGMRQITRWLAREADSWREVVQDIGYQEEGYWRVGPQPSLVAASEQTAYSVSSRESNPRRRLRKTGCSRNRQCRTRSSSMCTKQL